MGHTNLLLQSKHVYFPLRNRTGSHGKNIVILLQVHCLLCVLVCNFMSFLFIFIFFLQHRAGSRVPCCNNTAQSHNLHISSAVDSKKQNLDLPFFLNKVHERTHFPINKEMFKNNVVKVSQCRRNFKLTFQQVLFLNVAFARAQNASTLRQSMVTGWLEDA